METSASLASRMLSKIELVICLEKALEELAESVD